MAAVTAVVLTPLPNTWKGRHVWTQPTPSTACTVCDEVHTVWVLKSSLSHFKYGVGSTCLSYGYLVLACQSGGEHEPY